MKYLLAVLMLIVAGCGQVYDVSGPDWSGGRKSLTPTVTEPRRPLTAGEYRKPHSELWRNYAAVDGPQYSVGPKPLTLGEFRLWQDDLRQKGYGKSGAEFIGTADSPPVDIREIYFNPDGSCVQDAIAEGGVKGNNRNAASLLWTTEFGKAVRGGSSASRVSAYCLERGIDAWVITKEATWPWMQWAGSTGRGAAVSLDKRHFQFVTWYDMKRHIWYVADNRTPRLIEPYDDETFYNEHVEGGQWTVILDVPAPPPFSVTTVRRVSLGSFTWLSYLFA